LQQFLSWFSANVTRTNPIGAEDTPSRRGRSRAAHDSTRLLAPSFIMFTARVNEYLKALLLIGLVFATLTIARGAELQLTQSKSGGITFYHMAFSLTPTNSTLEVPPCFQNSQWRPETNSAFREDGFFEVFIRAPEFPIAAPNCPSDWIILRMPATLNDAGQREVKIAQKKALWDRLQKIYSRKAGSQEVIIELNPYLRVIDPSPPKVELQYCNVFFRHAHGAYVPYTGPRNTSSK
jgi:hypothetical protein